jgi:restriction system protein
MKGIWNYDDRTREAPRNAGNWPALEGLNPTVCEFCGSNLSHFHRKSELMEKSVEISWPGVQQLGLCPVCGWWAISFKYEKDLGLDWEGRALWAAGTLRKLDLTDITIPIEDLKRYLVARYADRFDLHPKTYEDIVGGLFRDHGYEVRVTSYSGDSGIDVFVLDGQSNDLIGVQVKRYKNKIEADQIREFAGSLLLNGATRGIFVTTSSYRKGAENSAQAFSRKGVPIELWDSEVFYDRLRLTTRSLYISPDDVNAPFYELWENPTELDHAFYIGGGRG